MAFLEIGVGLVFWICQSQSDMGIWDCFFYGRNLFLIIA